MINELIISLSKLAQTWLNFMAQQLILSTGIFLIVLLLSFFLRQKSLWLHFGLWSLVFIRLIIPPDFSWQYSTGSFINPFLSEVLQEMSASEDTQEELADDNLTIPHFRSASTSSNNESSESNLNQSTTKSLHILQNKDSLNIKIVLPLLLFTLWSCGFILVLFYIFHKIKSFHELKKRAKELTDKSILEMVSKWRINLGINRSVKIFKGELVTSPCTEGIFTPKIYLPDIIIKELTLKELEPIIAHELVHIRRLDVLYSLLQNLIQAFYFYFPIAWIANSRLNLLKEEICDILVIENGKISSEFYSKTMLKLLNKNIISHNKLSIPVTGFGNPRKKFIKRIKKIIEYSKFSQKLSRKSSVFVFLIGLLILPIAFTKTTSNQNEKKNYSVLIDVGHGGKDPGAKGINNISEKDLTLPISKEIHKHLNEHGITAYLTRETDKFVPLWKRPKMADSLDVDLLISVHYNFSKDSLKQGYMTFYQKDNKKSMLFDSLLHKIMNNIPSVIDIGSHAGPFLTLSTKIPSILIEFGYISNNSDLEKTLDKSYQKNISVAIRKAVQEYFNNIN